MITVLKGTFRNSKMLDYTTVDTHKGYEERRYGPSLWVSMTQDVAKEHTSTASKDNEKLCCALFDYIRGKNESKRKLDLTFPVTAEFLQSEGTAQETKKTLSYYIPPELSEDVPKPIAPGVYISEKPAVTVFVRRFGGYASDETCMKKMKNFITVLERDGHKVRDDVFYFAWYDSPLKLVNRRNEVWLVKEEEKGKEMESSVKVDDRAVEHED